MGTESQRRRRGRDRGEGSGRRAVDLPGSGEVALGEVGQVEGQGLEDRDGARARPKGGTSHGRGHVEGAGTRRGGARQKGRPRGQGQGGEPEGAGRGTGREPEGAGRETQGGARQERRRQSSWPDPARGCLPGGRELLAAEPGAAAGTQGPRAGSRASAGKARRQGAGGRGAIASPGLAGDSGTRGSRRSGRGPVEFQRAPGPAAGATLAEEAREFGVRRVLWRPRSGGGASRLLRVTLVPLGPASSDPQGFADRRRSLMQGHQTRLLRGPGRRVYELFVPLARAQRGGEKLPTGADSH